VQEPPFESGSAANPLFELDLGGPTLLPYVFRRKPGLMGLSHPAPLLLGQARFEAFAGKDLIEGLMVILGGFWEDEWVWLFRHRYSLEIRGSGSLLMNDAG
jgi:hypothetical protein